MMYLEMDADEIEVSTWRKSNYRRPRERKVLLLTINDASGGEIIIEIPAAVIPDLVNKLSNVKDAN